MIQTAIILLMASIGIDTPDINPIKQEEKKTITIR